MEKIMPSFKWLQILKKDTKKAVSSLYRVLPEITQYKLLQRIHLTLGFGAFLTYLNTEMYREGL
jgi:hypothetical protein